MLNKEMREVLKQNDTPYPSTIERIEFFNYADAYNTLASMKRLAEEYGYAAVADYYDLAYEKTKKSPISYDFQHGWTLSELQRSHINGSFSCDENRVCIILDLPKAKVINI